MQKLNNKKKAFTLIELLIVIAIIGILFIVLVSKVDFATDKAKASGVQTDFRSFQMALETVSKEKAGFNSFGWNTGDANANGVRDSVDEGDANEDGVCQDGETWTGRKKYLETWTNTYSLIRPGTTFEANGYDKDAIFALETAINKNLDPKLHITIDAKTGIITMANGAQDPWNTQYHGAYISAEDGMDRGAIVMYSNGANQKFGSEHSIANGVPTVIVPGNNKDGADDYSMVVIYTYTNGFGEVGNLTTGFSNNQNFFTGNNTGNSEINNGGNGNDNTDVDPINLAAGLYDSSNRQLASWNTLVNAYGLDLSKAYTSTDYATSTSSLYYIINNNQELSSATKLITGDDATNINAYSLAGCEKLTDIVISDSAAKIVKNSMVGCNGLKHLTVPFVSLDGTANFAALGYWFGSSSTDVQGTFVPSGLTTVIITNATNIGNSCFKGCTNITNIVIPDTVTKIGNNAFEGCTNLTTIDIPNSVTYIGHSAFKGSNIKNMTLPNSLTVISGETFYNCTNLTTITIPSSMVTLGNDAFKGCTNLDTVNVTDLTQWLKIEPNNAYAQPMQYAKELLLNGQSITGNFIVPDDVTILREYMLKGTKIESIVIHDNVTSIRKGSLMGCNNLKTITTPFVSENGANNGTYLGWFFGVDNEEIPSVLTTVIITSATNIGNGCFKGCTNITNIVIPDTVTKIGNSAFEGCTMTTIDMPNSVTYIGHSAFKGSNIKNMTLPNGLTAISGETFYNCTNLTTITIPSSMVTLGNDAFKGCTNLDTVNVTDLTQWLKIEPNNAYAQPMQYAKELLLNGQSITGNFIIPDDVTILREYILKGTKIESIVIHDNVTSIRKGSLMGCNNLKTITTPFVSENGVNNGNYLGWFFGVDNAAIPNSVTTIIITKATRIGSSCFEGCKNIKNIVIPDTVTEIGNYAFSNCSGLTTIYIPEGVANIGWELFYGCTGITTVNIPVSVTYISERAFAKSAISTIVFDGTIEQWNNVRKDSKWKTDSVLTTVQCSDGTIQLT